MPLRRSSQNNYLDVLLLSKLNCVSTFNTKPERH